jgi:hypothetical protein
MQYQIFATRNLEITTEVTLLLSHPAIKGKKGLGKAARNLRPWQYMKRAEHSKEIFYPIGQEK